MSPVHPFTRSPVLGVLAAFLLTGCSDSRFLAHYCPPTDPAAVPAPDAGYRIGCPDVLEVAFPDHPYWDAVASVGVDGRLPLDEPGNPQVEGLTVEQVRVELARLAYLPPERVHVRLAALRSSRIYLHGPVCGRMRSVAYQGPEPVAEFLKRVGGLPRGSELDQVYVVRPNVTSGGPPEVFRVDVRAELTDNPAGEVRLRPSDQVYVGETRRSVVARMLPDWLTRPRVP